MSHIVARGLAYRRLLPLHSIELSPSIVRRFHNTALILSTTRPDQGFTGTAGGSGTGSKPTAPTPSFIRSAQSLPPHDTNPNIHPLNKPIFIATAPKSQGLSKGAGIEDAVEHAAPQPATSTPKTTKQASQIPQSAGDPTEKPMQELSSTTSAKPGKDLAALTKAVQSAFERTNTEVDEIVIAIADSLINGLKDLAKQKLPGAGDQVVHEALVELREYIMAVQNAVKDSSKTKSQKPGKNQPDFDNTYSNKEISETLGQTTAHLKDILKRQSELTEIIKKLVQDVNNLPKGTHGKRDNDYARYTFSLFIGVLLGKVVGNAWLLWGSYADSKE